jgi:CRISPR/Cas system-associated exonuclease Cas4 (RecB family)
MGLPDTFRFSQASLQDYVDCPRRFQLRYVLMQPWPDLITGDPGEFEQQKQRGAKLHHLAHQHALGIDAERLTETVHGEILTRWWQIFLAHPPGDLPQAVRLPEVRVAAPLAGYRLMAKFDLLAVEPGQRLVVVDWKAVRKPPNRTVLARRMQTYVYRYLAVEASSTFNGGRRPEPEQVEMIYWFAERGGTTERFAYDAEQHAAAHDYLADLLAQIAAHSKVIWPLTTKERHCRFCTYRSLCDRVVKPGFLDDLDDDIEPTAFELDLEQVAEVEF